ncbi:MAG: hypothetical protein K2W95_30785 [Candidatus Obscuribacterales bacterium]|nr:hypothetical protein [Candidatus Obscuribacterales bacterium]
MNFIESAADQGGELLDFSPPSLGAEDDSDLISALSRRILPETSEEEAERMRILAVLERLEYTASRVSSPEHLELLARMRSFATTIDQQPETFEPPCAIGLTQPFCNEAVVDVSIRFDEPARSRMNVHVELLPGGKRMETFSNGSMLTKDGLGRVVEVRSTFGDCLFLEYSAFGHLESFTRIDSKGFAHSDGKREKHGVTVRDAEGRVRAAGESMTIDPWGCLYLHTLDGQYFSLDLVAGTHCERRRVLNPGGSVDFLTAIFAHDGFRMASMYAVTGGKSIRYRFYGRDGTVVEFSSEDDVKSCRPTLSCAPGTKPVHKTWLKRPQARTAWESVFDYLSRVS